MRLSIIAALVLALAAGPAFAQTQAAPGAPGQAPQQNNSRSFGSAICRPTIPCNTTDATNAIAIANSCVATYFGYAPPSDDGGFFNSYAGLDSSNCLESKPNAIAKGVGLQLSPVCCIIPSNDPGADSNACKVHCNLISTPGR